MILPPAGSFSSKANLTTRQLTGDLSVPDFDTPITFLGILPLTATVGLLPAGTTGTVELGSDGQLHVPGMARAKIVIKQLSFLGIPRHGRPVHDERRRWSSRCPTTVPSRPSGRPA